MSRSHHTRIKQLIKSNFLKGDKLDEHIESIIADVRVVATNAEHKRLTGTVQRKLRKAVIRDGRYPDVEETPFPKHGDVEVEITTDFSNGEVPRRNRVRVEPRNYGLEISADGPIMVNQMSSNRLTVVCCGTQEIYDFIAEEK